jgi:hypothetical protein
MEDEARYQREKAGVPAEHRHDVESGRSLAFAFTGMRQAERILPHVGGARDDDELGFRLLGVTWALTAREMNDPEYFELCLAPLAPAQRELLRLLPQRCRAALAQSSSYDAWRSKTKAAVVADYSAAPEARRA